MVDQKVCLVSSKRDYPAFDAVSSILREIVGQSQVSEVRIKNWLSGQPPPLLKFLLYIFQDLVLCLRITSRHKRDITDTILLFQGYYPLSAMTSKLLNMKLLLFIGGSGFYWSYLEHASTIGRVFAYANLPIQKICHKFADVIITLSANMIKMVGLENHAYKTCFALPRFDRKFYDQFGIMRSFENRSNIVGYLGSFYRRKGILNFIQVIPLVTNVTEDCRFLLIGGGPLLEIVKTEADRLEISESLTVTGFVDYDHLNRYYNEMKLYVLPTYAEGIPSTIFEAMACGTPVLTTPVGGIPDVIRDGETGFLLESNEPRHIAERIVKLLDDPELLEKVSANAHKHVREKFNEEKTLESWRRIFQNLETQTSIRENAKKNKQLAKNISSSLYARQT